MGHGLAVDGVFDIETSQWDTFVLGAMLDADGHYFETRDPDKLFRRLLQMGGQWWSHNGGKYDSIWFADRALAHGVPCRIALAGTRITRLEAGRLTLRDSAALVPMSLAKFAQMGGHWKTTTGLPCECGTTCGGYCAIRPDMSEAHFRVLGEYLRNDCTVTIDSLHALFAFAADNRIILAGTVGGASWRTSMVELGLKPAQWETSSHYRMARRGYYGGRTQVFRPILDHGYRYDRNSSYPAALATTDIPVGECGIVARDSAKRCFERRREGIYHVTVTVPPLFVPPLPWRTDDERLCFPVGRVTGFWTRLELIYAIERGCTIDSYHSAIVWEASEAVAAPYMSRLWGIRDTVGKETVWGTWIKWVANSWTGKCAMAPEVEAIVTNPDLSRAKLCMAQYPCTVKRCTRRCGSWRKIDHDGRIWSQPIWRLADCSYVHWSAYLTASARIELSEELIADGEDGRTAAYCDTDSVYASDERHRNIGTGLGEWLPEGEMIDWFCVAPKAYRYTAVPRQIPRPYKDVVRCKGVANITTDDFDRFVRGETVETDRGVRSFKSAARQMTDRLFHRKHIKRTNNSDGLRFGDRILAEDGLTYPLDCETIRKSL